MKIHLKDEDNCQEGQAHEGVHCCVRVPANQSLDAMSFVVLVSPELVDLDHNKGHDEIHHGCVKLEAEVRWADVEDCGQEPLGYQSRPYGVVEPVLLGQTSHTGQAA